MYVYIGSFEPSLLADAIIIYTQISCAGPYIFITDSEDILFFHAQLN